LRNSRAKPIWEQISLINFHRSLDHRSFYFKKNDKIFLNTGRFLKEPEERLKVIEQHFGIMRADEVAPKKKPEIGFHYTFEDVGRYVNSLELLTTIKPNLPE
jgi:paired amphipathic helix protein Sin3a